MKLRSLHAQILFLAIVPLSLLGLVGLAYLAFTQHQTLNASLEERGNLAARYAAIASEYGLISGDMQSLADVAARTIDADDIIGLVVENAYGTLIVGRGATSADGDDTFLVSHPVVAVLIGPDGASAESLLGKVTLVMDRGNTRTAQARALVFPLLLTLALLTVAWRISARLSRNIADPVSRIIDAVTAIEHGVLDQRVPEQATNELIHLEAGVNRMASALQSVQEDLEAHVMAATAGYLRANQELEIQNEQLKAARQAAEEATRSKSIFLANMSHEIRTPLNSILGYTQLIRRHEADLPDKLRSQFLSIGIASATLLDLVNDVLDFSRIEAGKVTQSIETFDLLVVLDDVAAQFAQQAQAKHLFLDVVAYFDVPRRVKSDRGHLHQILANFTSNAIKFTRAGGIIIRASLEEESEHRAVLLFEIEDTGIGIPVEHQERLFRPFEQLDASSKKGYHGTGLGLAISSALVSLLAGELGVRSEGPGKGSTFWFTLPVEIEPIPEAEPLAFRMAVLDPRLSFRQALLTHLHDLGFASVSAESTDSLRGGFDVVFTRWKGFTTTRREVRALKRLASAVVICLDVEQPEAERLARDGVVFVTCPARSEELRIAIRKALNILPPALALAPPKRDRRFLDTRVLVVDDNAMNRTFITELLSVYGPEIVELDNGPDAIDYLQEQGADIVLLDLHMPGMDGRETARIIRAAGNSVPIIAVTANALAETEFDVLAAGMNDLVTKPVDEALLINAMCNLLGGKCAAATAAENLSRAESIGRDLAKLFRGESARYDAQLADLDPFDYEQVRQVSHAISGAAATCYIQHVAQTAKDLEFAALDRRPAAELAELVKRLRKAIADDSEGTRGFSCC